MRHQLLGPLAGETDRELVYLLVSDGGETLSRVVMSGSPRYGFCLELLETPRTHRRCGYAAEILGRVLDLYGSSSFVLNVYPQEDSPECPDVEDLARWYSRFGFVETGDSSPDVRMERIAILQTGYCGPIEDVV